MFWNCHLPTLWQIVIKFSFFLEGFPKGRVKKEWIVEFSNFGSGETMVQGFIQHVKITDFFHFLAKISWFWKFSKIYFFFIIIGKKYPLKMVYKPNSWYEKVKTYLLSSKLFKFHACPKNSWLAIIQKWHLAYKWQKVHFKNGQET